MKKVDIALKIRIYIYYFQIRKNTEDTNKNLKKLKCNLIGNLLTTVTITNIF